LKLFLRGFALAGAAASSAFVLSCAWTLLFGSNMKQINKAGIANKTFIIRFTMSFI